MSKAFLSAVGLGKEYPTAGGLIEPLRKVDLDLHRGEMVAIMGPSGVGKTTLLLILGLLLSPTRGTYRVAGEDILALQPDGLAQLRRSLVGFVFQGADMVETCSVFENLELPLIYAGVPGKERILRIYETLEQVDMMHRKQHAVSRLSGGERQRVGVARSLVNRPGIILADEPTGQLDRINSQRIMDYFEQIVAANATCLVLVTHDLEIARRCQRIIRLEDGMLHENT